MYSHVEIYYILKNATNWCYRLVVYNLCLTRTLSATVEINTGRLPTAWFLQSHFIQSSCVLIWVMYETRPNHWKWKIILSKFQELLLKLHTLVTLLAPAFPGGRHKISHSNWNLVLQKRNKVHWSSLGKTVLEKGLHNHFEILPRRPISTTHNWKLASLKLAEHGIIKNYFYCDHFHPHMYILGYFLGYFYYWNPIISDI